MPKPHRSWNPIAFVPIQVTLISSLVYAALFTLLIYVHETVPSAPTSSTPVTGVNLTEFWLDLSFISDGYHPIDSRRNGEVKAYLLDRIDGILKRNGVGFKVVKTEVEVDVEAMKKKKKSKPKPVTVFVDGVSNLTYVDDFRNIANSIYTESENIMVYIRGSNDDDGDWWDESADYDGPAGVLVNAHYDSVASGFGATDDGVGVVTLLQLLSCVTAEGNQPKRGIVLLFNNGEEPGLMGAHAYLRHPLSQFTHSFLNLEGAGAGGRATLFRSTDARVTDFYANSPRPFGAVVSGDGFKRGLIPSETDYSVFFNGNAMRGVDVAFFAPRARYHTAQDDAKNTNADSVWHMLSAALATTEAMSSYDGDDFEGSVGQNHKLDIDAGSEGVWFDLFGLTFAVMELKTLFALTVILAVVGPIVFIILEVTLRKMDKWYPLSKRQYLHSSDDDEAVHFSGLRGLFRFPIAFAAATAAVLALAFLLVKINPHIAFSSEYAVWAMMLSAWFSIAWFFLAGADRVRPTALQRMYSLVWLYALSWVMLVGVIVGENNLKVAGGYFLVIYNVCVFAALLISYVELFALPTKSSYVERVVNAEEESERQSVRPGSQSSRQVIGSRRRSSRTNDDDEATERTSLLRGGDRRSGNTFTGYGSRRHADNDGALSETTDPYLIKAYGDEQAWSSSLPQFTWIVQFLILVPLNLILIGQISLLVTTALHQTSVDGISTLPLYLFIAILTTLLLLPLTPFLHRFTFHVPTLLFLVFVGCLLYNLFAFPFSRDARYRTFFLQRVDLDTGLNNVTLTGADGYLQDVVGELPSAIGQQVDCVKSKIYTERVHMSDCTWRGLEPNVHAAFETSAHNHNYSSWLDYNVSHSGNTASFSVRGLNVKVCTLEFDHPVAEVYVLDGTTDPRFAPFSADKGTNRIRLFSRTWDKTFHVNVTWPEDEKAKGQTGRVVCQWSDANTRGAIPAYDEVLRFMPVWCSTTKIADGLVEGFKGFVI